jgi:hypothetical protein
MNHQVPQAAVDMVSVQDTPTVPGESIDAGVFDDHSRPTKPYSAGQYQHELELRQRRLAGLSMGTMLTIMAPRLNRKPVSLTVATLAVVHQTAIRVLLRLTAPDASDEEFY